MKERNNQTNKEREKETVGHRYTEDMGKQTKIDRSMHEHCSLNKTFSLYFV